MDYPKTAIRLHLQHFLQLKKNRSQRIIDPHTLHQYEVLVDDLEYVCPICGFIQPAPPLSHTEYACPNCDWRYMNDREMLVIWDPKTVGRETFPLSPGEVPGKDNIHGAILESGEDSKEIVDAVYKKSQQRFLSGDPDWDKQTQVVKPASGDQKDE